MVFGTAGGGGRGAGAARRRAGRSTRRSWSGRTGRTATATPGRPARRYRFSKDWRCIEAVTYFTLYSYNFCWPVRTLRIKDEDGRWRRRTPGDGGGAGRSRLVDLGVVDATRRPSEVGHEEFFGLHHQTRDS